jgi:hypothetical protein
VQSGSMTDFILLQNYARNYLLRYFMNQYDVLDVEPDYKGKLEVVASSWRGTVKVVAREKAGRSLLVDPKWEDEGATVLAVYLLDANLFWFIDAPKLFGLVRRNEKLLEERYGKRVLPWRAVTEHLGGKLVDIRGLAYLTFEQYQALHR